MKRLVIFLAVMPCMLFAVKLTDYKVEQSSAQVLTAGLNYHLGMTDGEVVSHFGNLSANFERFQATLPWSYSLNFFGNISGSFLPQDPSDTSTTDTTQQFSYQLQWDAKYNKYLVSGKDFLAFAQLQGDLLTRYDYPATRIIAGLGYGRFTSATPLAAALRIERRMMAEGVLLDSLPIGPLMAFARELAPEAKKKYREKYYYWEREYYSALERVLNESNQLNNGQLGSTGSLIIKDVLDEYISPRYHGYEVNLGVGYDLLPAYQASGRALFAALAFNYSLPIGFRTQFIEKSNLRLPFTGGKFGNEIHGNLLLSLLYEVGSTLDIVGTYQLNMDRARYTEGGDYEFVVNNQLAGSLSYLLVDHLVMTNTLTLIHSTQAQGLSAEVSSTINFRFF